MKRKASQLVVYFQVQIINQTPLQIVSIIIALASLLLALSIDARVIHLLSYLWTLIKHLG